MPYGRKIVLHCPKGYLSRLDAMVDEFLKDGVIFVGVVGQDCAKVEDIIDELVVGDGSRHDRFILTTSHPGQTIDQAAEYARSLSLEYAGEVQIVDL